MNALQIKTFLWKNGLTITGMAKEIAPAIGWTFDTTRNGLTQLFYHGKYNADLAKLVRDKYGIKVDRPERPQTVSEAVRRAA